MSSILVVEDDPALRKMICGSLIKAGYVAVPTANGEAALVALEHYRPDVIISDLRLGGTIDGIQVLESIRASKEISKTPFILVSGFGDRTLGVTCGADCFLQKPFKMRGLLAMVKYLLHPEAAKRRQG